MIKKIAQVCQAEFATSNAENWSIMRDRVTENPLVNQRGEPDVGSISR